MLHFIFIILIFSLFLISLIKNNLILRVFSLFISSIILILSCYLGYKYNMNVDTFQEIVIYSLDNNFLGFSLSFGLDGISLFFFILSALLIFLCILFIWTEPNFKEYVINLLIIELFLLIIFSSLNLMSFYAFFEAILIPMYLIIGIWGSRERKIRAVYLFFFYTLCSSLLMLIAILYIYNKIGSLDFDLLFSANFTFNEQVFLWFAFFLSFASKIPLFPFHIWLPEAHVEAPTVGSVLLAGILLKLGVYGFLRFSLTLFTQASFYFLPFIYLLSICGILFASLSALRQTDLKRIIAYSSVAHMNLVTLGLFSFNVIGIAGSVIQSISHGFISGGLFLLIGIIYTRYHTRFLYFYGGLVHFMPIYISIFFLLTLGNIALPGTSSFVGEFMLLLGISQISFIGTVIASLGVILGGSYSLWLYNKMAYGNVKLLYTLKFSDVNLREFCVLFPLVVLMLIIGVYSSPLIEYIHTSIIGLYLISFF